MGTDMLRTTVLTVVLLTTGCATNRFNTPIGVFRSNMQAGNAAIGDFYRTRNAYERKLYLLSVFVNKDKDVLLIEKDGQPTPLGRPVFSEDSIKARLDALRLVGFYADRLAELAGSSAPGKFSDASALLGTNLASLDKQFDNLASHNAGDTKDPTASKFIGPTTTLVGAIGKMILEEKRETMIQRAVQEGSPAVTTILQQIQEDLEDIFKPQTATGQAEMSAHLRTYYNTNRKSLPDAERRKVLDEIDAVAAARELSVTTAPSELIAAILAAHQALVKLANSPRTPRDFAEFNEALTQLTANVQVIATEINTLRNL